MERIRREAKDDILRDSGRPNRRLADCERKNPVADARGSPVIHGHLIYVCLSHSRLVVAPIVAKKLVKKALEAFGLAPYTLGIGGTHRCSQNTSQELPAALRYPTTDWRVLPGRLSALDLSRSVRKRNVRTGIQFKRRGRASWRELSENNSNVFQQR